MKPLQPIALGLLVVLLTAPVHGYDLLADPLGWLLVMVGVRDLPAGLERRAGTVSVAWTATAVAVPLWVPAVARAIEDADAALAWALSLPGIGFAALLCHGLAGAAARRRDRLPAALFRFGVTANVVVAVLPVLIFGAGVAGLADPAAAIAALTQLAVVALCFLYADRSWAMPGSDPERSPAELPETP